MKINCNQCLKGKCEDCNSLGCLCREDHSKNKLLQQFTDVAKSSLPDVDELKKLLQLDADADKTILADEAEFNQKLQNALGSLSEVHRITFLMNRIEQITYTDIALRLDISVKTVEKRMSVAIKHLYKELGYKL